MTQPRIALRASSLHGFASASTPASVALGSAVAAILAVVSFAAGGYGQAVWPWIGLPMLWACVLVLVRPAPLRTSRAAVIALALFLAWSVWAGEVLHVVDRAAGDRTGGGEESGLRRVARDPRSARPRACSRDRGDRCRHRCDLGGSDRCAGRLSAAARGLPIRRKGGCCSSHSAMRTLSVGWRRWDCPCWSLPLPAASAHSARCLRPRRPSPSQLRSTCRRAEAPGWRSRARSGCWASRTAPRPGGGELVSTALAPAAAVAAVGGLGLVSPSLSDAARDRRCVLAGAVVLACSVAAALLRASRDPRSRPDRGHSLTGCRARHRLRAWTGRARRRHAWWSG